MIKYDVTESAVLSFNLISGHMALKLKQTTGNIWKIGVRR
jgi:hypothetical protein